MYWAMEVIKSHGEISLTFIIYLMLGKPSVKMRQSNQDLQTKPGAAAPAAVWHPGCQTQGGSRGLDPPMNPWDPWETPSKQYIYVWRYGDPEEKQEETSATTNHLQPHWRLSGRKFIYLCLFWSDMWIKLSLLKLLVSAPSGSAMKWRRQCFSKAGYDSSQWSVSGRVVQ